MDSKNIRKKNFINDNVIVLSKNKIHITNYFIYNRFSY
jgi:hypothetical protein